LFLFEMASDLTNGESNKMVEECCEGSKVEAGSESPSCSEQRTVNSAEPHVTFHDSGMFLPTSYNKAGPVYSVPVKSTAYSTPFNYASPASPKGVTSSVLPQGYPGTYTLAGGQNVSYFTTTAPPTVSNVQTTYSSMMPPTTTTTTQAPLYTTAASTPYFPSSVPAPTTDRAVVSQQYPATYTTTTMRYPTTTYPTILDQQPQTYTLPQNYTVSPSVAAPQSFTLPQSYPLPSYQVPTTIEEGTYPLNYPAVADYPMNLQAFNPNTSPFSQEDLAAYYQNYLAKNQESRTVDYAPSHKAPSVKNDSGPLAKTNQSPLNRKCAHGKPPVQRKRGKGCCGC